VLDSAKKGNQYEILAYSILNYLFLIADKWGGKSLPDGILGIGAKENRRFIFWDAKCYDDTKLSQYAKKTKAAKDIQYIIKSLEQEDTYEEGKLAHYLFITSNTHKDDFLTVKKTIDESIESLKLIPKKKNSRKKKENPYYARLKQINFCCMNIEDLIGLGEMLDDKETRDTLLRNWNAFEIAFEETITENDGYASIDALKQKLNPVLTAQIFIPQKETHRRDN
jgi:hypothetical protein